MAIRKDGFKEHLPIREGLDLVEEDDQITHMLQLDGKYQTEDLLNIFRFDKTYLENEANYKGIRDEILGSSDEDSDDDESAFLAFLLVGPSKGDFFLFLLIKVFINSIRGFCTSSNFVLSGSGF